MRVRNNVHLASTRGSREGFSVGERVKGALSLGVDSGHGDRRANPRERQR